MADIRTNKFAQETDIIHFGPLTEGSDYYVQELDSNSGMLKLINVNKPDAVVMPVLQDTDYTITQRFHSELSTSYDEDKIYPKQTWAEYIANK